MILKLQSETVPDANGWSIVTFKCPTCSAPFKIAAMFDELTGSSAAIKSIDRVCKSCGLEININPQKEVTQ